MKINLTQNYTDDQKKLAELEAELAVLDEKLKTPERTLDDIIRHIQILKEIKSINA